MKDSDLTLLLCGDQGPQAPAKREVSSGCSFLTEDTTRLPCLRAEPSPPPQEFPEFPSLGCLWVFGPGFGKPGRARTAPRIRGICLLLEVCQSGPYADQAGFEVMDSFLPLPPTTGVKGVVTPWVTMMALLTLTV